MRDQLHFAQSWLSRNRLTSRFRSYDELPTRPTSIRELCARLQNIYAIEGHGRMEMFTVVEIRHNRGPMSVDGSEYISAKVLGPNGSKYLCFTRTRGEWRNNERGPPTSTVTDLISTIPNFNRRKGDTVLRALSFANSPLPLWKLVALARTVNRQYDTYIGIIDTLNLYGELITHILEMVYHPFVTVETQKEQGFVHLTKDDNNEWCIIHVPDVQDVDLGEMVIQYHRYKKVLKQMVLATNEKREMDKRYLEKEIERLTAKLKQLKQLKSHAS